MDEFIELDRISNARRLPACSSEVGSGSQTGPDDFANYLEGIFKTGWTYSVVSYPSGGAETDVVHDAVCLSTIHVGGQAENGGDITCMPW